MKRWIWVLVGIVVIAVVVGILVYPKKTKEPEVIKIGAILVLTGPDAKAGQSAREGIELAVNEINSAGGIKGNLLEIVYEDDAGDPAKAVSAAKKLIDIDKVPAVIGPMWSSSVLAVAPIAEKKKVVILSPTASAPSITKAGDYIFRNTYSDVFEGTKDAEFAYKKLGYKQAAVIHINIDAGVEIVDVFQKKFEEMGGKVILREAYEPKTADFRSILLKLKDVNVDFVYLMGYNEMGQLIKQMREIGIRLPILSTIMVEISDVLKIAGEAAEGIVYSYPSYDPEKGGAVVKKFAETFHKEFGHKPDPEAAFSYDAIKLLALAMKKEGFSSDDIKRGLYSIKNYYGVTGTTSFDENGDVIKPIGFKKIENGKYKWIVFQYE